MLILPNTVLSPMSVILIIASPEVTGQPLKILISENKSSLDKSGVPSTLLLVASSLSPLREDWSTFTSP